MVNKQYITIGIPAKNEANSISNTLKSLVESICILPPNYKTEIIVALNGSTDNTDEVVDKFIKHHKIKNVVVKRIESKPGKINAQREIIDIKKYNGLVFFFDADVLIDKYCLQELVKCMGNKTSLVAFACPIPVKEKDFEFWKVIFNFSDYYPELLTKRNYIIGRGYAIKNFPDNSSFITKYKNTPEYIKNLLSLTSGPLVDDIFLTKYIIKSFSLERIKYCEKAIVYFHPITNILDFYYSQRRVVLERKRLEYLFPEYTSINRKIYKRKRNKQFANIYSKIQYYIYIILYSSVRKLANIEYYLYFFMAKVGIPLRITIWPTVRSSKKSF